MPITKSAIKAMKQSAKRQVRRQPVKTLMKTMMRKVTDLVKEGKLDEAKAVMAKAQKAIDMASKKKVIHWKNAARKKSLLARMVAAKK